MAFGTALDLLEMVPLALVVSLGPRLEGFVISPGVSLAVDDVTGPLASLRAVPLTLKGCFGVRFEGLEVSSGVSSTIDGIFDPFCVPVGISLSLPLCLEARLEIFVLLVEVLSAVDGGVDSLTLPVVLSRFCGFASSSDVSLGEGAKCTRFETLCVWIWGFSESPLTL